MLFIVFVRALTFPFIATSIAETETALLYCKREDQYTISVAVSKIKEAPVTWGKGAKPLKGTSTVLLDVGVCGWLLQLSP